MMDERMDLSALELDGRQRERLVASIMKRAAAELSRRALNVSPIAILSGWLRPALAAAAIIAAVCMSVLTQRELTRTETNQGYADALDVPAPMNEWLASGRSPTAADLMIAMERE